MIEKYLAFFKKPCPPDVPALVQASQNLLGEKRFRHVQGVHRAALGFASLFQLSAADTRRLELAVWFHDFVKGADIPAQKKLAEALGAPLPEEALRAPSVIHAVVDAWIIPNVFGVHDASMEAAVYHHTTGHPSLDLTGRLLFLADYCEEGRGFDSGHITRLLPERLDEALFTVIKEKIIYVLQKDQYLHSASLAFYHALLASAPQ